MAKVRLQDDIQAQLSMLEDKLNPQAISKREGPGGMQLSYLEGWYIIDVMNRAFGFNGWSGDIKTLELVTAGEAYCVYQVEAVFADGSKVTKTGVGHGTSKLKDEHEANGMALKEAETDAMKRACRYLGNKFGNSLYDKQQRGVE